MIATFKIFNEFLLCEGYGISGKLSKNTRNKFIDLLKNNIVSFKFVKKDGTIRKAKGTLAESIIPEIKGNGAEKPSSILTYYDVEKKGWRSFNDYQFIKLLSVSPIDKNMSNSNDDDLEKNIYKNKT